MKKTLSSQEAIEMHIKSDKIIDIASIEGDYKTNNKEYRKRNKLFDIIKQDMELAKKTYKYLLTYDCISTQISSSVECLKLCLYVDEAEKILEEISKRKDIGDRRLEAEMCLKVWRGEYPGKTL